MQETKGRGMTMNRLVTIRSSRYGLDIELDSETEFDQLLEVLGRKIQNNPGAFLKMHRWRLVSADAN